MTTPSQQIASEQFANHSRWPNTYREPTGNEWLQEVQQLKRDLAAAQSERDILDACNTSMGHEIALLQAERDKLKAHAEEILQWWARSDLSMTEFEIGMERLIDAYRRDFPKEKA